MGFLLYGEQGQGFILYLVDVEPVEDVDGPEVLRDVVLPELPHPLLQRGRVDQLLEVGVVEALLGAERDLTLDFLKKKENNVTNVCKMYIFSFGLSWGSRHIIVNSKQSQMPRLRKAAFYTMAYTHLNVCEPEMVFVQLHEVV